MNAKKWIPKLNPKVVCISEIGLDFLSTSPKHEYQYQAFKNQIQLAKDLNKPIILHSRESNPEVIEMLRQENANQVGGVFHYFQVPSRKVDYRPVLPSHQGLSHLGY